MVLKITNLHILKYLPTCWLYLLECYTIDNQRCTHTASKNSLAVQNKVKENHHVPMTVDEVCTYLGISKSSFYYKVKHGGIPVIKQGKHLFVYRDELDKWLETGRKVQVPLTFEEEQTQMLASTRRKANPKNV